MTGPGQGVAVVGAGSSPVPLSRVSSGLAPLTAPFDSEPTLRIQTGVIQRERPHLWALLDRYGDLTVAEYAALATRDHQIHPAAASRLSVFCDVVGRRDPAIAAAIADNPTINTTGHFGGPKTDPIELSALLMSALPDVLAGRPATHPYFTTGNIVGANPWVLRGGFAMSHVNDGRTTGGEPFPIHFSLFPAKMKLPSVLGRDITWDMKDAFVAAYPRYTPDMVDALVNAMNGLTSSSSPFSLSGPVLTKPQGRVLREVIRAMYMAGLDAPTFEAQMTRVNDYLWDHLFAAPPSVRMQVMLADGITQESFAAQVLNDPSSWLSRILFDREWREGIICAINGVLKCWNETDGSHFFWRINYKGQKETLRVEGDCLVSVDDPEYRVSLTPEAILAGLERKELTFGLFMQMATFFYFGILPLGGPMQIQYATEIRNRLVQFLNERREMEEAAIVESVPIDRGWIAGPTIAFADHGERVVAATAADILMAGGLTSAHLELLGRTNLRTLFAVSVPAIWHFITGKNPPPRLSVRPRLEAAGLEGLILPKEPPPAPRMA